MPLFNPQQLPLPVPINFLELFGHSYFNQPVGTGTTTAAITTDQTGEMNAILIGALGLAPHKVRNHAQTSAQITQQGVSQSGFARILTEITRKRQTYPFVRTGGCYILCMGINDIGHQGNSATVQSAFSMAVRMFISRARSAAIYPVNGGANWAVGANITAGPAANLEWTSGSSMHATVIDSSGTSTATFTIPIGYKGEPICFSFVGTVGTTGGIITWGGTISGTSGIIGTTTDLNSRGVGTSRSCVVVRFTSATNGLSSVNAGQTITSRVTTISGGGDVAWDSCWIEASKPDPVIICNIARLACRKFTLTFGDGVTTGATTNFTSATAAFVSGTDAGNAITEIDAQGAFTAGKTVASVTNATTIVLSAAAAAAHTNIQFTLDRTVNGYALYSENTNFSGATPASHAAADADVATFNALITSVVAEFDSMVQIADLDQALGFGDTSIPSSIYTYFALIDGIHPNEFGNMQCAEAIYNAIVNLKASDGVDLGFIEVQASPASIPGAMRLPRVTGQVYLPEFSVWAANYTAVAGDMFAIPIFVTEGAEKWTTPMLEQINAPATSGSNIRWGVYDDVSLSGYPRNLMKEPTSGATFAMGTTAGVKTPAAMNWNIHYGLYWLVLKIDSLGTTASQLRAITGPNYYLPNWVAAGGATTSMAWKLTGVAAGVLPTTFPTGAVLVSTAPAIGITIG